MYSHDARYPFLLEAAVFYVHLRSVSGRVVKESPHVVATVIG